MIQRHVNEPGIMFLYCHTQSSLFWYFLENAVLSMTMWLKIFEELSSIRSKDFRITHWCSQTRRSRSVHSGFISSVLLEHSPLDSLVWLTLSMSRILGLCIHLRGHHFLLHYYLIYHFFLYQTPKQDHYLLLHCLMKLVDVYHYRLHHFVKFWGCYQYC